MARSSGPLSELVGLLEAHVGHSPTYEEACSLLGELARYAPVGRHLVEPWKVVVAGAPNVGKSSLVNALAGLSAVGGVGDRGHHAGCGVGSACI